MEMVFWIQMLELWILSSIQALDRGNAGLYLIKLQKFSESSEHLVFLLWTPTWKVAGTFLRRTEGQDSACLPWLLGIQTLPSVFHRPFADPVDGNALLLKKMLKLSQLLLPSQEPL